MISYRSNPTKDSLSKEVAAEHLAWARSVGMSNYLVFVSIGLPASSKVGDETVLDALERTWLALQLGHHVQPHRNQHTKAAAE